MENRRFKNFKDEIKYNKSALFAILFLLFIVLISIFAFLIPIDPDLSNTSNILQSPSSTHIF